MLGIPPFRVTPHCNLSGDLLRSTTVSLALEELVTDTGLTQDLLSVEK